MEGKSREEDGAGDERWRRLGRMWLDLTIFTWNAM